MANNCVYFDILAEHSSVHSKKYTFLLFIVERIWEQISNLLNKYQIFGIFLTPTTMNRDILPENFQMECIEL